MTKSQIIQKLKDGEVLKKSSYTKWKRNKIVRGTYFDFYLGDNKITSAQFDAVSHLVVLNDKTINESYYVWNENN